MKRWFDPNVASHDLWEWDPNMQEARWVSSHDGHQTALSGLVPSDFIGPDLGPSDATGPNVREVFPPWGIPPEFRLPEGL